jgi:hypothetical protein
MARDHPGSTSAFLRNKAGRNPRLVILGATLVHVSRADAEAADCRKFEGQRLEVEADPHAEKVAFQPRASGDEQTGDAKQNRMTIDNSITIMLQCLYFYNGTDRYEWIV